MKGLRAEGNLSDLLRPIAAFLDGCWWCLGGVGASVGPRYPGKEASEAEMMRWRRENERAVAEYSLWVDSDLPSYRVGLPGFFSRYADCVDSSWVKFYVSDAAQLPVHAFDEASGALGWFEAPPAMPADICLIVRDIDGAYWDLFFRDDWAYEAVNGYLGDRAREFVNVHEEHVKRRRDAR